MQSATISKWLMLATLLAVCAVAPAFAQQQAGALLVQGRAGQAAVIQINGRAFVDVEGLAQITNGSLSFERDRILLTLPAADAGAAPGEAPPARAGFSQAFMNAAIEAIASMREWGSSLVVAIQNGYPVGNAMTVYRGRAADRVRLASAAVTTEADRGGLELLSNEFKNVQAWSDKLVAAQKSMNAGNLTMSEDALQSDPMFQGIVRCGQFLGPMLASGALQDDPACH